MNMDSDVDAIRSELDSRLRTIRSMHQQLHVFGNLEALWKEAAKQLGAEDPLTVEIEAAVAWVGLGYRTAAESVAAYEALLRKTGDRVATPVHFAPKSAQTGYAKALRRAGSADAIRTYRQNIALREAEDAESRWAGIARTNLAAALRERGNDEELLEAHRIVNAEVKRRTERYGRNARFTLVAREIASKCSLSLWRTGRPLISIEELLEEQREIVEQRSQQLGDDQEATIGSRITFAEVLAEAGQVEEALWVLMVAKAKAFDTPLDDPHRLGVVYAECCLKTGNRDDLEGARIFVSQAMQDASRLFGPGTPEIERCRKTLAALDSALQNTES